MRVLVVDDEDSVCVVIEMMLSCRQHETVCVATGSEALQAVKTGQFGLALVDWSLPDMTGSQTLAALRSIAPDLKTIVITGVDPQAVTDSLGEVQPDAILRKPFTMDVLHATVVGVCGG